MARWLVIAVALVGCSRASDEGNTKKWQSNPPPKDVDVPPGLSIGVSVEGADKPPITSEVLKATKPDFVDADHRAWRIPTLIGAATPGTTVEAATPNGVAVRFAQPTPDGYEPVLFLTRRGELIVAAVDPKDPFPRFHGQGSRMRRPGDAMPHVAPVAKLTITRSTP